MPSNISNFVGSLYATIIVGNEKALAAFVVAAVASFVARHGLKLDVNALAYVQAVVIGLIAHFSVYFTTNTGA